jgi:hypothetical protein
MVTILDLGAVLSEGLADDDLAMVAEIYLKILEDQGGRRILLSRLCCSPVDTEVYNVA